MSGLGSGSHPYSVTESNAVLSRTADIPSETFLNRRLVRNGSPSPANIRVGSSFSRLNGKTPAVYGNSPGLFSRLRNLRLLPSSLYRGRTILLLLVPHSVPEIQQVRLSLSRTF